MSPRTSVRCIAVSLALAWVAHAHAHAPMTSEYATQFWDSSSGLPHNSVSAITQTPDGYLWVGTFGGVARFDGVNFTSFSSRDVPEFRDNVVQDLYVDPDGRVWVGTGTGGVVVYERGRWTAYSVSQGLPSEIVYCVMAAGKAMLIGTQAGLAILENGTITHSPHPEAMNRPIWVVYPEPDGSYWLGSDEGFVARVHDGSIETFGVDDGLPTGNVRKIVRDGNGVLWVATDFGVARRGLERFEAYRNLPFEGASVRAMAPDGQTMWVGAYGGLARVRGSGVDVMTYDDGLPGEIVRAIYVDKEQNVWFGMGGAGLGVLKPAAVRTLTSNDGLGGDVVRAIFESRDGSVWIGTLDGGVTQWKGDHAVRVYRESDGLPDDGVLSLSEDLSGAIWVGTRRGVARIRAGSVERFPELKAINDDQIRGLFTSSDGSVWIGAVQYGVVRYKDGEFTLIGPEAGLSSSMPFYITEDLDGSILVATHGGGLNRLRDGVPVEVIDTTTGLPTDRVWSIDVDAEGAIWVACRGAGLVHYREGVVTTIDAAHGLYDDVVYHVIDDGGGRLWMSSNRGIFFVRKDELTAFIDGRVDEVHSVPFGKSEGMLNTECNGAAQPAGWRMKDGTIWFPTLHGVAIVNPSAVRYDRNPPDVLLEAFTIDGSSTDLASRIRVAPDAKRIEIRFTGVSLSAPRAIEFQWRLSPYDADWFGPTQARTASYTDLPPGEYHFEVSALSREGVWSPVPASVKFVVLPHSWEKTSFRVMIVSVVLLIATLIYFVRVRSLRAMASELEGLVASRTKELESANQRLETLSLVDGLTGVANRRAFDAALDREWRRAQRDKTPVALILFDIDAFKGYNDTYGHLNGDDVLKRFAEVLAESAKRPGDVVARYGGEEFVILLSNASASSARAIAESVRSGVEALGIPNEASPASDVVTTCAGVASITPDTGAESGALIDKADAALYEAKRTGRNKVATWGSDVVAR